MPPIRYSSLRKELGLRPCAGVMCDLHQQCVRYALVDGTTYPSAHWLPTCAPLGAPHPAFIDVDFIGPPHPEQYRLTRDSSRRRPVFAAPAVIPRKK